MGLVFFDDGIYRANFNASPIINAFGWVNFEMFFTHGNCVLWAFRFTGTANNAFISNYVRHLTDPFANVFYTF